MLCQLVFFSWADFLFEGQKQYESYSTTDTVEVESTTELYKSELGFSLTFAHVLVPCQLFIIFFHRQTCCLRGRSSTRPPAASGGRVTPPLKQWM